MATKKTLPYYAHAQYGDLIHLFITITVIVFRFGTYHSVSQAPPKSSSSRPSWAPAEVSTVSLLMFRLVAIMAEAFMFVTSAAGCIYVFFITF